MVCVLSYFFQNANVIVKLRQIVMACLLGLVAFSGCDTGKNDVTQKRLESMAGGKLKKVVPVKGVVKVDGTPAVGVNLFLYREDSPAKVVLETRTDQDGKYCWSTNLSCDGVEPGKYVLGFTHIPKPKKNDTGEDLFKGKYKNAQKNKLELVVEDGKPQDKADYDLVTK